MNAYVINKMLSEIEPTKPFGQWVLEIIFRVPQPVINTLTDFKPENLPAQVYRYYAHLQPVEDNVYLSKLHAARADLIASLVDPPDTVPGKVEFDLSSLEDPSYWLCTHILGFTDRELSVLCEFPEEFLPDPKMALTPLLLVSIKVLKGLETDSDLLTYYHRTRYLLIRYYLDAYYHLLNG